MIYLYIIPFILSAAIGAWLSYLYKAWERYIEPCIGFIAAYIFATTLLHLLPEIYAYQTADNPASLLLLAGFLFQHFLVQLTRGVEHGHAHKLRDTHQFPKVIIALIVHAYLEGLIGIHTASAESMFAINALLFGIFLHKLPAAFVLTSMLRSYFQGNNRKTLLIVGIFSLATPSALLTVHLLEGLRGQPYATLLILPFLGGMFLHLSIAMFFEVAPKHIYGWRKNSVLLLGMATGVLTEYAIKILSTS